MQIKFPAVKRSKMPQPRYFSLRQVRELSGLSEFTLRGWESRYGAFDPSRTPTGRRQYSLVDLQRAILLKELTESGVRIHEVASLPLADLEARLGAKTPESPAISVNPEVSQVLHLTSIHDWDRLEAMLAERKGRSDALSSIKDFFIPLLNRMGEAVAQERLSITQEHILSALLKVELDLIRARRRKPTRPDKFLVVGPEGDFHEMGILLADALLVTLGIRSLYIGPNVPKSHLAEAAIRYGASRILIGSTISRKEGAKEDIFSYLHFLDDNLAPEISIWVGGRAAAGLKVEMKREFRVIASLDHLQELL